MTLPVPDTSPEMLSLYLRARIFARQEDRRSARAAVARIVKRDAAVSHTQFNAAVAGRRLDPETTARIWKALGVETGSPPASAAQLKGGANR